MGSRNATRRYFFMADDRSSASPQNPIQLHKGLEASLLLNSALRDLLISMDDADRSAMQAVRSASAAPFPSEMFQLALQLFNRRGERTNAEAQAFQEWFFREARSLGGMRAANRTCSACAAGGRWQEPVLFVDLVAAAAAAASGRSWEAATAAPDAGRLCRACMQWRKRGELGGDDSAIRAEAESLAVSGWLPNVEHRFAQMRLQQPW